MSTYGGNVEIRYSREVAIALAEGRPVVALESTLVSHGLPRPDNLTVARDVEQAVRGAGAVPATIGMISGELVVGLDDTELTLLANSDDVAKLSVRDLAVAAALGRDGATTVSATSAVAASAGVSVFATGGLGGVHRHAVQTFDESADLAALARTPIVVVCAGVKSILDVGATLQRLESLGVSVVGYRTDRFPGFLVSDSGFDLDWTVHSAQQVAQIAAAQRAQAAHTGALVLANPLPVDEQLDPGLHDRALADGLALLAERGVEGKEVTPFLLSYLRTATGGASLTANIRVILRNAALAAEVAVAIARFRAATIAAAAG